MEAYTTVTSNLDGWEIDVYDGVNLTVAQWIADALGSGVDYITACDVAELSRRVARSWLLLERLP